MCVCFLNNNDLLFYMKSFLLASLIIFGSLGLYAQMVDNATPNNSTPTLITSPEVEWQLDFSDEFANETLDLRKWTVDESLKSRAARPKLSISDWWWKPDNVSVEQDNLVLRVDKYDYNTMYCGSVSSNNKYETKYGFFEARIKIADASKGTHTAFWLQGDQMSNVDGTANDGAEIDIFESAWLEDYTKSVIHIDGYGADHQANTKQYTTLGIHNGYHIYGMHWTKDFIKIYYDGVLKVTYDDPKWVVKVPEFLWLSDGASFGYSGDNFTREPDGTLTQAYFDYVRVWKEVAPTVSGQELECELLNYSTSQTSTAELKIHSLASNSQHIRLVGNDTNNEIVFQVPITVTGNHTLSLQSLTWSNFGQYECYIESSPGNWQLISDKFDLYSTDGKIVVNNFYEIFLQKGTYNIMVVCVGKNTATSNYYGSFDKFIVNSRNIQTSIEPEVIDQLKIYPNPVTNELNIEGLQKPTLVKIYNVNGMLQYTSKTEKHIDVSHLTKGSYFLKIESHLLKFQKI